MRTALLDLPSQSLTSVLEPRFRCLGRKLILRIAFGKVGGSIPSIIFQTKCTPVRRCILLGADGQIRSFVIQSLQASADVASHMFEIPHKFLHSLFIIRSNKNRRQTASGDISKDMSQRYLGLCISEHSLNRSFCQFVTSSSFTTFPFVVTICIFSSFAMCSLDSGSE